MSKKFLTVLAIGLAIIGLTELANAAPINYLTNSSFENSFNGWSIVNWNGASSIVTDEKAEDGQYSIKTVHTQFNPNWFGGSWTSIGQNVLGIIQPDTDYLLSFYYLTSSPYVFYFGFGDSSQVMHSSGIVDVNPITDGAWHQVTATFNASSGKLNYEPMLAFFYNYNVNMGTIYLDNITVTNLVPEPATFALLGIGLAGIGFIRRRRALKVLA